MPRPVAPKEPPKPLRQLAREFLDAPLLPDGSPIALVFPTTDISQTDQARTNKEFLQLELDIIRSSLSNPGKRSGRPDGEITKKRHAIQERLVIDMGRFLQIMQKAADDSPLKDEEIRVLRQTIYPKSGGHAMFNDLVAYFTLTAAYLDRCVTELAHMTLPETQELLDDLAPNLGNGKGRDPGKGTDPALRDPQAMETKFQNVAEEFAKSLDAVTRMRKDFANKIVHTALAGRAM